jgi:hypothetical protein
LVIGGSITFGVSWGLALLVTLAIMENPCDSCASRDVASVLWVPVFGPILASRQDATQESSVNVLWYTWSLIQAAGAAMFTLGLIGREVEEDPRNVTSWQLNPLVGPQQAGLSLSRAW